MEVEAETGAAELDVAGALAGMVAAAEVEGVGVSESLRPFLETTIACGDVIGGDDNAVSGSDMVFVGGVANGCLEDPGLVVVDLDVVDAEGGVAVVFESCVVETLDAGTLKVVTVGAVVGVADGTEV